MIALFFLVIIFSEYIFGFYLYLFLLPKRQSVYSWDNILVIIFSGSISISQTSKYNLGVFLLVKPQNILSQLYFQVLSLLVKPQIILSWFYFRFLSLLVKPQIILSWLYSENIFSSYYFKLSLSFLTA